MQSEDKKFILLVEDQVIVAKSEANLLKKNGYEVIVAYNGKDAISKATENPHLNLILMDIDLGKGIDGTEAAQIILKDHEIPIVFLLNDNEKETVEKTEKITSYGYILKNSGEAVLIASIKMALKLFEAHTKKLFDGTKLLESDRKFHMLEKQIDDVIWTMDMNFRLTYISPSVEKMFGYTVSEMMQLNLQDYLAPESVQKAVNALADQISEFINEGIKKNVVTLEIEQIRKDGTIFPAEIKARFLLDSDNSPNEIIGVTRDITFRKKTESLLSDSEKRLNLALEGAGIGMWDQDFATGKVYRSDNWAYMLGYMPDEIEDSLDFWKEHIHPDDYDQAIEETKKHEQNLTELFKIEHRLRCKNGSYRWILNWGKISERDSNGKPIRALGLHLDINDRINTAESLRLSEERLRYALEGNSDGIWDWNLKTNTVYFSPRYYLMLGYEPDEFEPSFEKWKELLHPDDVDKSEKEVLAAINELKSFAVEFRLRKKDGSYCWILERGKVAEKDKDGKALRLSGSHTDIKERKLIEEALRNNENKISSVFRVAPIGIGVTSNRMLLELNDYIYKMLGYASEELIGKSARILYPTQEEYELVGKEKYKQIDLFGTGTVETKWVCKDGRIIDILLSSTPLNLKEISGGVTFTALDITGRKRSEEALKKSQERFALAQRSANIGSWEWNILTGEVNWSETIEPMFGFNKGEFDRTYDAFLKCIHPEDVGLVVERLNAAINKNEEYKNLEFRIVWSDGTVRWMLENGSVFRDTDEKPNRMIGIVQDITDKKKAEQTIIESERKLSETLKVAKVGYWEYYVQTDSFVFNDQYYSLHNTTAKEAGGYTMSANHFAENFVYPEDRTLVAKAIAGAVNSPDKNYEYQTEARILTVDKKPLWVTVWFKRQIDERNNTIKLIGVNQDINSRKLAEEKLKLSEENYRRFFEEDLSGVFLSTPGGKIKECNQAYVRIMEYDSIEELLNSNPVSHYPESQQRTDFLNLLRKERKLTNYEGRSGYQKRKTYSYT